jgi:hypothetical protein
VIGAETVAASGTHNSPSTHHPTDPPPQTSNNLAKVEGPYATYEGSPISQGKLQVMRGEVESRSVVGLAG